jgi:hypothetical protein
LRHVLNPKNIVIAVLAFVALSGTAFAAATTINGANLITGSVSHAKLATNSVRHNNLGAGAVTATNIAAATLARLAGATGATGATCAFSSGAAASWLADRSTGWA